MEHKELFKQMADKYAAGEKEHGGGLEKLSSKVLAENALEEAIDMCFYLEALIKKL